MYAKLVIIGEGAAGIFAAIAAKEADPHASIVLSEKTAVLLSKVRISGGGRCDVTHACIDDFLADLKAVFEDNVRNTWLRKLLIKMSVRF